MKAILFSLNERSSEERSTLCFAFHKDEREIRKLNSQIKPLRWTHQAPCETHRSHALFDVFLNSFEMQEESMIMFEGEVTCRSQNRERERRERK